MKYLFASLVGALALLSLIATAHPADAGLMPPPDRSRGLVYDGLLPGLGVCPGAYRVQSDNDLVRCTHGPDPAPIAMNVAYSVGPITDSSGTLNSASVVCDGDGVSGPRVQVLYVHASNVPDQYASFLPSFQQWIAGVEAVFQNSAAQTGGARHVRFVTDASCAPIILDVALTTTGANDMVSTESELAARGYNRSDRKYLLFVDAHVYCGISDISPDDQPGPANSNNRGATYSRIDAGCWSDIIAAHELAHQLGGVQMSAPHSSGDYHCWDMNDIMCRPTNGTPQQFICPNPGYLIIDCNDDDFYSTNPPANTYLATHWNTANNQFLIGAQFNASVKSVVTGSTAKNGRYTVTSSFKAGDTVTARAQIVNAAGANLGGIAVTLSVISPTGGVQCSLSATSGVDGSAQGSCPLPRSAPSGSWHARATLKASTNYRLTSATTTADGIFTVR